MAVTREELASHAVSVVSGGLKSYGAAVGTGGVSFWARMANDIQDWSALDLITAAGIVFGIVYGGIRAYRDISEHIDRKREMRCDDE